MNGMRIISELESSMDTLNIAISGYFSHFLQHA